MTALTHPRTPDSRTVAWQVLRLCNALMAACLLYAAATSLLNDFRLGSVPYQLDYEEGNILNAGIRINAGLTPYPPQRSWPVILNPYGPIPYQITAALIRIYGVGFPVPRRAVLVAAILVALGIGLLVHSFTSDPLIAVAFGSAFLSIPIVELCATLLRVDLLGLAFSVFGLWIFFHFRGRWKIIAVFCFVSALLCKITFLAAPLTVMLILARKSRWRELILGLCVGGAALGAITGGLQWTTHGAFLFHQFGTHRDPWSLSNYCTHIEVLLGQTFLLVALSICGVIRLRRLHESTIYLFIACLGTVTLFKLGSESNHLLELAAALCTSAAVGMWQLQQMTSRLAASAALAGIMAAMLAGQGLSHRAMYTAKGVIDGCPEAYAYIRQHNRVLSENVGALVLTGRPVFLSNAFVYSQLVRSGHWPDGEVEKMLQQRDADLVVIGKPSNIEHRWSDTALQALAANYVPTRQFSCPDIAIAYEPRPAGATP
jgi:hypothetical protein